MTQPGEQAKRVEQAKRAELLWKALEQLILNQTQHISSD